MYSTPQGDIPSPERPGKKATLENINNLDRSDVEFILSPSGLARIGKSPDTLSPEEVKALSKRITELTKEVGQDSIPVHSGNGSFQLRPNSPQWKRALEDMREFDNLHRSSLEEQLFKASSQEGPRADFSNVRFFAIGLANNYAERTISAIRANLGREADAQNVKLSHWTPVRYADGGENFRLPNVRKNHLVIFIDPSKSPNLCIGELSGFCTAAKQNHCSDITVISPYFPMRSDRPTRDIREAAMYPEYIARLKAVGVNRLLTFDPHFKQFGLVSDGNFKIEAVFPSAAVLPYMQKHLKLRNGVNGVNWLRGRSLFQQPSVGFISPDNSAYARNKFLGDLIGIEQAEVAVVKKRNDATVDSRLLMDKSTELPVIALGSDDIGSSLSSMILAGALAKHGHLTESERQQILDDPTQKLRRRRFTGSKLFIGMVSHMQAVGEFAEKALSSPYVDAWVITDTCSLVDIPMGKFGPTGPFGNRIHAVSTAQITADALQMLFAKQNGFDPSISRLSKALIHPKDVLSLYGSAEKNISHRYTD